MSLNSLHKSGISLHFHPTAEHNHNLYNARALLLLYHNYKICFPFFNSLPRLSGAIIYYDELYA